MEIIEVMFLIALAIASFAVAAYVAVNLTKEKLGARSGLFGFGVATMFVGFIWSMILKDIVIENVPYAQLPTCSRLSHVCLIIGLVGIVMMAVDILKTINELRVMLANTDALARKQGRVSQQEPKK